MKQITSSFRQDSWLSSFTASSCQSCCLCPERPRAYLSPLTETAPADMETSLPSRRTLIFSIPLSLLRLISMLKSPPDSTQWRQKVYEHKDSKAKMWPLNALYTPEPQVEASPAKQTPSLTDSHSSLLMGFERIYGPRKEVSRSFYSHSDYHK